MNFLILGAGALGGYFGAKLLRGGADVEFLVRPGRATQLAAKGLVVTGMPEGDLRTPVRTVQPDQIMRRYDIILLTCKAYDLNHALASVTPAIGSDSTVLPFLNGIKHLGTLTERFGQKHVLGGLTFETAVLTPDGSIVRPPLAERIGMTAFGELNGEPSVRCHDILNALAAAGMKAHVSSTIVADMWAKFSAFVSSAAIATLCRSRAAGIAAAPAGKSFVFAAIEECNRIVTAEGYPMPIGSMNLIRDLYNQQGSRYCPSIFSDMLQNRKTESEQTVGDMADRAARHGISAPILTAARCNLQIYEAQLTKVAD